tara:strand:+ start:82 stop:756 length:675 start_codon:yes stop_codon:yes gene_type:complete
MIGIIAAMNSEYALFKTKRDKLFDGTEYKIVKSGIGPQAAAHATLQLINSGCDTIVGWGFAGGLSRDFDCGQIIIANRFVAENTHYYSSTPLHQEFMNRLQSLNPYEGTIFAADKPIFNSVEKQDLAKKYNSVAVDMESLGIISVAEQRAIPYFCIRVILDDSKTTLPSWVSPLFEETESIKKVVLLLKELLKPVELYNLIRLAFLYKRGAVKLNRVSKMLSKQ